MPEHITVKVRSHNQEQPDCVAVEEPLEIRIGGRTMTVMMRTPGRDRELIIGFLFCEGLIADVEDLAELTLTDNQARIRLNEGHNTTLREWPFLRSSSCGVCGATSIPSSSRERNYPNLSMPMELLTTLPARMRAEQPLFQMTGGVHAAALFTPDGTLTALREDVGRHNALDKLIGWAVTEGMVPLRDHLLLVSGRVSYDIMQKAIVAGLTCVAAVGAPSSYAVALARQYEITLIGFLRETGGNLYSSIDFPNIGTG